MNKLERLKELGRHRREHVPRGCKGIGEYHGGAYECDFVSPYTKSAQKLDADIMLVLQDWASDEYFHKRVDPDPVLIAKGHDPTRPTNKNLKKLLQRHFGIQLEQTYATNIFPFIKPGAMSARVPDAVAEAAKTYTVREIELVEPKLVVCLGRVVTDAIRNALGLTPVASLEEAIAKSPFRSGDMGDTVFWAQFHPSRAPEGGADRVSHEWQRMAAKFV